MSKTQEALERIISNTYCIIDGGDHELMTREEYKEELKQHQLDIKTIRTALSAQEVDVERLKKLDEYQNRDEALEHIGWNDCLDHCKENNLLRTKPEPIEGLEEALTNSNPKDVEFHIEHFAPHYPDCAEGKIYKAAKAYHNMTKGAE